MGIVKKFLETRDDGVNLYIAKSDRGYKIIQNETGAIMDEAVDVESANYTYKETDILIGEDVMSLDEATNQDYIEALERLGVS